MTDYFYVDTASSGGDGTTRGHSGSTAAFASLYAALNALSLADDTVLRCAGSTADTTQAQTSDATFNGYTLQIVGDKGEDDSSAGGDDGTGFDDDGFYDGALAWSTSHYRLDQSAEFRTFGLWSDNVIVDGIQIGCDRNSAGAAAVDITRHDNGIRNCRIKSLEGIGINLNSSSFQNYPDFVENNILITDGGTPIYGIKLGRASNAANQTTRIYNNLVDGYDTGIGVADDNTGDTWEIHNNIEINCGTGFAINVSNATVNATYNAGETTAPTGHTSNWVQLSGTLTDDLEDPNNATFSSCDYTPVASGNLDDAGLGNSTDSNVPTTDIAGNSRDSSSPDIGPIELQSGASTQELTPSLFTNTNTFYAATVAAGAITLTPALYTDADTFYTQTVTTSYSLTAPLYTDADTFYAPTVAAGAVTLTPSLYSDADTFYTHTITGGAAVLAPALYTDADTFYAHTAAAGAVTLTPSLYSDADTFYSATVAASYGLTPALFTDADTFYAPTVTGGGLTLQPSLYEDADTFYTHTITGGAVVLTPALYSDADTFYSATVSTSYTLTPALYTNSNTFYTATVAAGAVTLTPSLYTNTNTFYTHTISGGTEQIVPAENILSVQYGNTLIYVQRR